MISLQSFLRERRVVGPYWEQSQPKGPKGPVSVALAIICRMDSISTSYPFLVCLPVLPRHSNLSCSFPPLLVSVFPSLPPLPPEQGRMVDRARSVMHSTVFPASPSTPTAPATAVTTPAVPAAHTCLPSLLRPVFEESGAHPLARRACSGAMRRYPLLRSAGASVAPCTAHHVSPLIRRSAAPRSCSPLLPTSRTRLWPSRSLRQAPPAAPRRFAPLLPIPALPLRRVLPSKPRRTGPPRRCSSDHIHPRLPP